MANLVRLQKFIADCGVTSRRKAEDLIVAGKIRINGEVQRTLGTKINPGKDVVEMDKQILDLGSVKKIYAVLHKPRGYMTTLNDPEGRPTVMDFCKEVSERIYPVGRLDYATEGVLLLTDASKIATALMGSGLERIYKVKIKGEVTKEIEDAMMNGLELADATAGGHFHSKVTSMSFAPFLGYKIQKNEHNYSILKIAISEGKNREIRRFFAHFGTDVADLKRISFAEIELNNLPTGKTRFLTRSEYSAPFTFMKADEKLAREQAGNKKKFK